MRVDYINQIRNLSTDQSKNNHVNQIIKEYSLYVSKQLLKTKNRDYLNSEAYNNQNN